MSAAIESKVEYIWKRVGHTADVSFDAIAHLMYYVNCVSGVLDIQNEGNIDRITSYKNYRLMTNDDVDTLLNLCQKYCPRVLDDTCFFHDDDLCKNSPNEFYEIGIAKTTLSALTIRSDTVVIAGHSSAVKKIMVYKSSWMLENYHEPMKKLEPWLKAIQSNSPTRPVWKCKLKVLPKYPFPER